MKTKVYLDPHEKLVDAVAGYLCGKARRDAAGAWSLAHLLVVVPTAESGRQLRLKLACEAAAHGWGGVLPPRTVLPMELVRPADDSLPTATPLALRAAFLGFLSERPRRHLEGTRTVLEEWTSLFQGEYIADFRSHLAFFDQLQDVWRVLAGGGLLMREVASLARTTLVLAEGDELRRWQELGEFETAFFDFLHARNLRPEVEAVHLAKSAARVIGEEFEEVVLPALVDPVSVVFDILGRQRESLKITVLVHAAKTDADRFDEWGRPLVAAWTGRAAPVIAAIRDDDIVRAATDAELARLIARDFPAADSDAALPALGLCDESLYPEVSAALLNIGYELNNPERHQLAASSLGRIVDLLISVYRHREGECPWKVFAALMREDDVFAALASRFPKNASGGRPTRLSVLAGLDICRNTFLPQTLPKGCAFDESRLRHFDRQAFADFRTAANLFAETLAAADATTPGRFVRSVLGEIYAHRPLGASEGDREFQAAAGALREVLEVFDAAFPLMESLSEGGRIALLRQAVAEAAYSLEPDSKRAVRTLGWLELAWSSAERLGLAGFHEGAVPDSVMGHQFLPDRLRQTLGLTSNSQRLARDTFILQELVAARSDVTDAIRFYVSLANNAGDIRRPSRLLFLVSPERLPERTRRLFGELAAAEPLPPRRIAPGWALALPETAEPSGKTAGYPDGRYSASAIDTWLKCPFTYLLKCALNMRRTEEKDELGADDFGTIVHRVLELYAAEQLERTAKGLPQLADLAGIEASLAAHLAEVAATFGAKSRVNLGLQFDAVGSRLKGFARIQAKWAQDGWVVAERPEFGFETRPFAGEGDCDVPIKGSVDRIDHKEGVGYRVIDYKTWDERDGAQGRILPRGVAEARHAERLRLPVLGADGEERRRRRFLSIQLPLYARCLETVDPARFAGKIADLCYVILGKTDSDIVVMGSADDQGEFEVAKRGKLVLVDHLSLALDTARTAIRRIRANIFWPPGPKRVWRYDIKDLIAFSPERDTEGTPWRLAQERRLKELAEAH